MPSSLLRSLRPLWLTAALLTVLLQSGPVCSQHVPAEGRSERDEVDWLERESMLSQAATAAQAVSGRGVQWRHRFGEPQPREAVRKASVWLLDYPGSVITPPDRSVIATWGEPRLWDAMEELGVDLLHTGPLNRAGGVRGREFTPTLDGWFDRISLDLDPALGTEAEYSRMVEVAGDHGAVIAGDLVPLHTGLGADFQLAVRAHRDYPGMYTMVEIDRRDWSLLPKVKGTTRVDHLPKAAAETLARKGYLPGLINSNDAAPEAKTWSGWSVTGEVAGVDGKVRRWAYLHYFKPMQPALNWSDPSFAAQRAIVGDAVRTVLQRKTPIVRLDAVPFLGIEPKPGTTETIHFKHPLSITGTDTLAYSIRKLGGWSFHELNVPLETLKTFTRNGPDLSYDFFTRAQCLDALLTGDAAPLRLAFRWLLEADVQPISLVHDLQNHDEITYQLVEPEHRKDELFDVGGKRVRGGELRDRMLGDMRDRVAGPAAPYNRLYRPERDGVATTFAGFVAPALGVRDPYDATQEQVDLIRRGHLLLAAANALQPGVFSLSSWDLVGALPISAESVESRIGEGDYRWINRGGVDLTGAASDVPASSFGLPRSRSLYGPLPEQLKNPRSFASQLKRMLEVRRETELAEAELLRVPEPKSTSLCVLVFRLPDQRLAVTVLNFGREDVVEDLVLQRDEIPTKEQAGPSWTDPLGEGRIESDKTGGTLTIRQPRLSGTVYVRSRK